MVEGTDFKVLPVQAFSALQSWYGGGPELVVVSNNHTVTSPASQETRDKLEVNSEIILDNTTSQFGTDTPSLMKS